MVLSQVSKSYTMEQNISVYIVTTFTWKSVTHTHTPQSWLQSRCLKGHEIGNRHLLFFLELIKSEYLKLCSNYTLCFCDKRGKHSQMTNP